MSVTYEQKKLQEQKLKTLAEQLKQDQIDSTQHSYMIVGVCLAGIALWAVSQKGKKGKR